MFKLISRQQVWLRNINRPEILIPFLMLEISKSSYFFSIYIIEKKSLW